MRRHTHSQQPFLGLCRRRCRSYRLQAAPRRRGRRGADIRRTALSCGGKVRNRPLVRPKVTSDSKPTFFDSAVFVAVFSVVEDVARRMGAGYMKASFHRILQVMSLCFCLPPQFLSLLLVCRCFGLTGGGFCGMLFAKKAPRIARQKEAA